MTFITDRETFAFDLRGYIIFKRFIAPDLVKKINTIIDNSEAATQSPKFGFVGLDPVFKDIITDPRILETCHKWIDPHFRFDHAWGVQQFAGATPTVNNLHAGPYANQGYFQYNWYGGKPRSSCLIFSVVTEAQAAEQGGLVVIPGSHKSYLGMTAPDVYSHVLHLSFDSTDFSDIAVIPSLEPGDLLVFTEALMHGSAHWQAITRRRRNLYFKYCLGSMGWLPQDNPDIVKLRESARNPLEERLFAPSCVATRGGIGGSTVWRPATYMQTKKNNQRITALLGKLPQGPKKAIADLFNKLPDSSRKHIIKLLK
jgi:hypothetical protein